jgi:hypothetical protein
VVWFFLALSRMRHTPLFAISVAIALGEMYPYTRWVQWFSQKRSTFFSLQPEKRNYIWKHAISFPILIPIVLIISSFVFQINGFHVPVIGRGWAKLDHHHWPMDILPELERIEDSLGDRAPIYNDDPFGGFLIFFAPRLRVFIDDRFELYGGNFLRTYIEAAEKNPEIIDSWAKKYGFSYALTVKNTGYDKYLSHSIHWKLIKKSEAGSLYQKILIAEEQGAHHHRDTEGPER